MKMTIEQALQKAIQAHKAGKLQDAEGLYRAILQAQPNHPDANHNLGVLAVSLNQTEAALPLFKIALYANQNSRQFWLSYLNALIKEQQFDNARNVLEQGKKRGLAGEGVDALEAQLIPLAEEEQNESILQKHSSSFTQKPKKVSVKKKKSSSIQINLDRDRSPSQVEVNSLLEHYQKGRYDLAESLAKTLTQKYPDHQLSWKVLGGIFMRTGRLHDSLIPNQRAAKIKPNDEEAHYNLGNIYKELDKLEEAAECYKKSISIRPDLAEAHCELGNTLFKLRKLKDAEICYKKSIAIKPNYAETYYNLGNTLKELDKLEEAAECYIKSIAIKPDLAEAHSNLGNTLKGLDKLEEAAECYKKSIAIKPDLTEAHSNLGITLYELGRFEEAISAVTKSISVRPTGEAKRLFVELTKKIDIKTWNDNLARLVVTALSETWNRPSYLMSISLRLLKADKEFVYLLNQINSQTFTCSTNISEYFLSSIYKKELSSLPLLSVMLSSSPIPNAEVEMFLTSIRYQFLLIAEFVIFKEIEKEIASTFYSSLAQQCFINEYVYFQTPDEINRSLHLREKLTSAIKEKKKISEFWILAVACYFPLHSVEGSEELLQQKWSINLETVLKQQIHEPLVELKLRQSINIITDIENKVSLQVKNQYEKNPYPRWTRLPKDSNKKYLNSYIQSKFPSAGFQRMGEDRNLEILIAGCGTGQHSIGTSQLFKDAKIFAIDLSMASLSYAKRKTVELGIDSIEYAQADILKLNLLGRKFDVIESSGVLHHLESPFDGWEVLLSLLRPYGLMRLGFYSEIARRDIVRVRNLISSDGFGSSPQDIRNYRKYLLGLKNSDHYGFATSSTDFYSTSACRDLLFHVQEHRMNLLTLDRFLKDNDLTFLGFEIDSSVIQAYKKRFVNDTAANNLGQWHIYEEENPDTFIGMYQFYVQKES